MTMGADPIASAALAGAGGEDLLAFFVRKEKKAHGLQRWVEGPLLSPGRGAPDRRGRRHHGRLPPSRPSNAALEEGLQIVGTVSVLDRLAGGAEAIEAAGGAPYTPLATIDDVHPERDDR